MPRHNSAAWPFPSRSTVKKCQPCNLVLSGGRSVTLYWESVDSVEEKLMVYEALYQDLCVLSMVEPFMKRSYQAEMHLNRIWIGLLKVKVWYSWLSRKRDQHLMFSVDKMLKTKGKVFFPTLFMLSVKVFEQNKAKPLTFKSFSFQKKTRTSHDFSFMVVFSVRSQTKVCVLHSTTQQCQIRSPSYAA